MSWTPPGAGIQPPAPDRPAARRLGAALVPRSLAARLTIGVLVLAAVLIAVPGSVTYVRLRSDLANRLDAQLESTARGSVGQLLAGSRAPSPQTVWIAVLSGDGSAINALTPSGSLRLLNLSAADRQRLSRPQAQPSTVHTTDGFELRVVSEQVVVSEPQGNLGAVMVLGLSTDSVQRTLHGLLIIELLLAAGAALLAMLAAFAVRVSLRPLHRLTRTARQISGELSPEGVGLDRRAPLAPAELGSEAAELTQAFNTLLDTVETQFAARLASELRMRQFLADASHELRTPLTSIRGYAELENLRRRRDGLVASDADSMSRIEAEGNRMAGLIEDLLLLARGDQLVQSGQVSQFEAIDIADLLAEATELTRISHPGRLIELEPMPAQLWVAGTESQLLRVVRNLLTNAAIHTRPDGGIRLRAGLAGDTVIIQVEDDGPGMTPAAAAHAFERFWRADESRVRATGGSGLGLSIVESMVTAHGGTIGLESSVHTGTRVSITLPALQPALAVIGPGGGPDIVLGSEGLEGSNGSSGSSGVRR